LISRQKFAASKGCSGRDEFAGGADCARLLTVRAAQPASVKVPGLADAAFVILIDNGR